LQNANGETALMTMLRFHNVEEGEFYDGRIQDLFAREGDITGN